jgi:hypothetical protein
MRPERNQPVVLPWHLPGGLTKLKSARACCAVCSGDRSLTSHHIHPQEFAASYPAGAENIDEAANRVVLCQGCHQTVHEKKPYAVIVRELRTKLRRAARVKANWDDDQMFQSLRDQEVQRAAWKRLVKTLQAPALCARIEDYRRIIRTVERLHESHGDSD